MIQKKRYLLFILVLFACSVNARQVAYTSGDSVKIVRLLSKVKELPAGKSKMVFLGKLFLGVPYVANTLENGKKEQLVVNLHELDCTTFVETITALTLASEKENPCFDDFTKVLLSIRYRNGELNGYASRLHYFSDWIQSNVSKGLMEDVTKERGTSSVVLNPFFMSTHADKYPRLKNDISEVEKIKEAERSLQGKNIRYFAKADLNNPEIVHHIKDGDIIAIVTNIKGLDIAHVGIATYENGELHLLHASSKHMKVVVEGVNLYTQLLNNKTQTGIRVIRIK